MGDDNGAPEEKGQNGRDPQTGRFLPGWEGGPGRPPRPDFMTLAREAAKRSNKTLEEAMVETIITLQTSAQNGDTKAAAMLWDRVFGPVLQSALEVNVDARSVNVARMPEDYDVRKLVSDLSKMMEPRDEPGSSSS